MQTHIRADGGGENATGLASACTSATTWPRREHKTSTALAGQRSGTASATRGRGELPQLYVPEDGLAGGAHQRVAEGLAVGVVQILDGPAPRFSLVQEAVLPIVQPLKIQPGADSAHTADTEEAREGWGG